VTSVSKSDSIYINIAVLQMYPAINKIIFK
jgi:hypothetical protein